jgi:preprotein translocase subunit YajC
MKFMKTGLMLGAATAMVPALAFAQTSAPSAAAGTAPTAATTASAATTTSTTLGAGAKVLDTSGGTVGTIESVDGDFVVLATSKSKVRLPKTSFAMGPNGPVIAMTAAQVDAAVAQAAPSPQASATKPTVAQGATVADMQGGSVGTISTVDAQFATVQLTSGGKVRLPINAFGAGSNGGLRIAMTAQQLSAAAGASGGGGSH